MAGEHTNMMLVAEPPAGKPFVVDLRERDGWVEVDEFESLRGARDARERLIERGLVQEGEVRVRGDNGRRWGYGIWFAILGVLAVITAVLYGAMLMVE